MTLGQFYLFLDQIPKICKLLSPTAPAGGASGASMRNIAKATAIAEMKGLM